MTKKEDCKICMMVYHGIPPYENHQSRGSGTFLLYVREKYGAELMQECEDELKNEQ